MEIIKKKGIILAFITMTLLMFVALLIIGDTEQYYDSVYYWSLGKSYNWNSTNLDIGFRGYLLPFLFFLAYKFGCIFGNEFIGLWLLSSLTFAVLHTGVFIRISDMLGMNSKLGKERVLLCGCLAGSINAIFFIGLYKYALSDVYAFTLMMITIVVFRDLIVIEDIKRLPRILSSFVLGGLLYGIYNIRTIYIFLSLGLLVVFIFIHVRKRFRRYWYELPFFMCGLTLATIPMIRLNKARHGIISWKVPTNGLMLYQIYEGVFTDRYATYVGDSSIYTKNAMFFYDRIGQDILRFENIELIECWGEYFKLLLKYPLDFIGIYFRHLMYVFYPIFPNQFVKSVEFGKGNILILAFCVFFVSFVYIFKIYRFNIKNSIILLAVLFPCMCILPGAVEDRFFFGLYYLCTLFFTLGFNDVIKEAKTNKVKYSICFVFLFGIYIAICGCFLSSTTDGSIIISGL